MKRRSSIFAVAVVCLALAGSMFADSKAFVGTWKLNLEKSKYAAGQAPKSLTRTVSADGDAVTYKFEGVGADGTAFSFSFTSKYDGKDAEVTGAGMPYGADHIAIKQVNSHETTATLKKGDKVVGSSTATVSHDGKMVTLTSKGTDANGKPVKSVSIYDKQ
ncbi:MAG: hypothetical protein ABR908_00840 [Terriglobales bacterium]|jgi:hypothetical protein